MQFMFEVGPVHFFSSFFAVGKDLRMYINRVSCSPAHSLLVAGILGILNNDNMNVYTNMEDAAVAARYPTLRNLVGDEYLLLHFRDHREDWLYSPPTKQSVAPPARKEWLVPRFRSSGDTGVFASHALNTLMKDASVCGA